MIIVNTREELETEVPLGKCAPRYPSSGDLLRMWANTCVLFSKIINPRALNLSQYHEFINEFMVAHFAYDCCPGAIYRSIFGSVQMCPVRVQHARLAALS